MLLSLIAALEIAAAEPAHAQLARLAVTPPAESAFSEFTFNRMTRRPILLHGRFEYRADGTLAREVESPFRESTRIENGFAVQHREGRRERRVELTRAPELAAFLDAFQRVLAGDAAGLAQRFTISLETRDAQWRLTLAPSSDQQLRHIRSIDLSGSEALIECLRVTEADGDERVSVIDAARDRLPEGRPDRAQVLKVCQLP